jgi:DNA repair ATPase RecN
MCQEPGMSSEEMRRTMEFIVQQQAEAWSSIQSLKEIVREHSAQIEKNSAQIAQLGERVSEVTNLLLRLGRATDEMGRQTDERFRQTDERFRQTDERINALIALADRYFSNGGKR